ncbi:hypothetical protein Pelo_15871 [Pelomyxa schiedti]|nr:hypothetical protein Pelo_15871 [Pelomyxa schiedti]
MLAFAHRTAISRTTGFSPFYLEHGRDARTPGALLDHGGAGEAHGHAEKLTRRVCEAWKLAQRTAELTKQTWHSSRKLHIEELEEKYQVGDLVYVLQNGETRTGN